MSAFSSPAAQSAKTGACPTIYINIYIYIVMVE